MSSPEPTSNPDPSNVPDPERNRSSVGRPYRKLRRWARHTPNGTIALNMIATGVTLIFVAIIFAIFVL